MLISNHSKSQILIKTPVRIKMLKNQQIQLIKA